MPFVGSIFALDDSSSVIQGGNGRVLKIGAPAIDLVDHLVGAGHGKSANSKFGESSASALRASLDRIGALVPSLDPTGPRAIKVRLWGDERLRQTHRRILPGPLLAAGDNDEADLDILLLSSANRAAAEKFVASRSPESVATVSVMLDGHDRAWIGPLTVDDSDPSMLDCLGRRLMNSNNVAVETALQSSPLVQLAAPSSTATMTAALSLLAAQLELSGDLAASPLRWAQLEFDVRNATLRRHVVLPLPDRPFADPPRGDFTIESVVDPTTGIVLATYPIIHDAEIPSSLKTVQSRAGNTRHLYKWTNNVTCGGSAFNDESSARLASIGEALERYCGNLPHPNKRVLYGSFNDLVSRGETTLDPERLVLYGDHQYESPHFPFQRFGRTTPAHWIDGWSLTTGQSTLLPAALCYVNWHKGEYREFPKYMDLAYPGIAAGADLDAAIVAGIQEVIERDATMVWWLNAGAIPEVPLDEGLTSLWAEPRCANQHAWALEITNEFRLPVVAGIVHNTAGPFLNVGFACKSDLRTATKKAWTEALTLQEGSRDLLNPDSRHRRAIAHRELAARTVREFRKDRSYLDDFRTDFSDVDDLMVQQTVYLDPRAIDATLPKLRGDRSKAVASVPIEGSLACWQQRVEERGYEIFVADMTTPDVAVTGVRVVRVLIPGLVCNAPAAFPLLGGDRVLSEAKRLGMVTEHNTLESLNYWPLPHA